MRYNDDDDFDESFLENMFKGFDEAIKSANSKDDEYKKLASDPCMKIPEVGDTVVVAAGLLGMGHIYIRMGAKVLIVGDSSYFVQFDDYKLGLDKENYKTWVNPVLVTDVIKKSN